MKDNSSWHFHFNYVLQLQISANDLLENRFMNRGRKKTLTYSLYDEIKENWALRGVSAEHIPQSSQYFHGHKLMSKMCADISGVSSPLCRRFLYSASSQSILADSLQLQVYQMAASLRHRNASIPQQPLIWYRTQSRRPTRQPHHLISLVTQCFP